MKTAVYNLKNEMVGEIELPKMFEEKWRPELVRQVAIAEAGNARAPWAHAKTRSEVRGGGKKPWRQKGTGRARHGSIRSPLWRGGGKAHGPLKDRDYSQKVNKKMKRAALASLLAKKLKEQELKVFSGFQLEAPKTKVLSQALRPILGMDKNHKKYNVLLIADAGNKALFRAGRNLPKTLVLDSKSLNLSEILRHKNVFIDEKGIADIAAHYGTKK